jgi:hypothetical protein
MINHQTETKTATLPPSHEAFAVLSIIENTLNPDKSNFTKITPHILENRRFSWPTFCILGATVKSAFKNPAMRVQENGANLLELMLRTEAGFITGKRKKILVELAQNFSDLSYVTNLRKSTGLKDSYNIERDGEHRCEAAHTLHNNVKDKELKAIFQTALESIAKWGLYPENSKRAQNYLKEISNAVTEPAPVLT